MQQKRAVISVVNDLVTDQRVDRTARVLLELGYEVLMVGRQKHDSPRMPERPYQTHRLRLLWEKGPMFYAEFNLRLFFFLITQKCTLLVSNDLDTLLPNYLLHQLKKAKLVYDSHEYFTQTPELTHRPFVQGIWKRMERTIIPRLKYCITVNASIAALFEKEYGIDFAVVRNIPAKRMLTCLPGREELGLPGNSRIVLLQGAGINIQRGAEEAVLAMQYLQDTLLLIIGGGDVLPVLKKMVAEHQLDNKVRFIPKQSPDQLFAYTSLADLGLTLDKDTNLNYRFSLPNKLFDYIHAGIPVLASPLPEIRKIIEEYQVGAFIDSHEPEHIAEKISSILADRALLSQWKQNARSAAEVLNWDEEKKVLIQVLTDAAS